MAKGKIRVRLKSYDSTIIDAAAQKVVEVAKRNGSRVSGPIPLPTDKEIVTILRAVHKHNGRGKLLGNIVFSRTQNDIHALKSFVAGFPDHNILALELQSLTCAACAGQRNQLANREITLLQNADHFLSHSAGCAKNSNSIEFLHC